MAMASRLQAGAAGERQSDGPHNTHDDAAESGRAQVEEHRLHHLCADHARVAGHIAAEQEQEDVVFTTTNRIAC